MSGSLTIGAVARLACITPDTIRYYERLGLLPRPSRTPAGYRQYGGGVVDRAAQMRRFGGEFFPAQLVEGATGRSFLEFFQRTRDDEPVGIVAIN
jgi:hypothetical protein